MDYFTRAWALGDLSEEESERVTGDYWTYIASLDEASSVRRFATTIGLHDAYVDQFKVAADTLSLRCLTGDLQRGYWHTEITYQGGRILSGQDALERAVWHRPTEIWYDEFAGRSTDMIHRLLLVSPNGTEDRGEIHIAFSELRFAETPATGRELPALSADGL